MKGRRHAAVMFTDIVGYTALMGSDEDRAIELLRKNREIHKRLIRKYGGNLVKEIGDGMMVSFALSSYAVRCALEISSEARVCNIPLKIGIHEGEVIQESDDIFGDGVNIASRIQASAPPQSVTVSGTVYHNIRNNPHILADYIGEKKFKNVHGPVKVYSVSGEEAYLRKSLPDDPMVDRIFFQRFKPLLKAGFAFIPVLAVIAFFLFYGGTSLPFKERDWIVITDFDNRTGQAVFDHSLTTAFMISINQSRHINVLSRQRMQDALTRMKIEDADFINEKTGREIAVREGLKICITPSISLVGNRYVLTAVMLEAGTGDILRSEILYADDQDDILHVLDKLCRKIRHDLGESRYRILQQNKSLPKVTTASLDALREYALGIDNHKKLRFDEALFHYREAIRLDSTFTAAKASLGNLLMERYDRQEGKRWLEEAIVSIDDLTEREKYGILAFYAVNVLDDLDRGIEYTKTRIELYPDDPVPHNNLAWYYQNGGQFDKATKEYKAALQIDPYMSLANGGLNWLYLEFLGRMDSLLTWSKRMIEYTPENPWGYFYLGSCYAGRDELREAEREFRKALKIDPDFRMCAYRLAHVLRMESRPEEAIPVLLEILKKDPEESSARYDLAINYKLTGNDDLATACFQEYKKIAEKWLEEYPDDPKSFFYFGILLTHLGEKEQGWEIGKKGFEMDTTMHFELSQLLAVQGKKSEAIDHLEKALKGGYRDLVWIKMHPDLQSLHDDPRFLKLLKTYFNP